MKKKTTRKNDGYLHGYSSTEQDRLYHQARFLEFSVYEDINYRKTRHLLEVACGVGGQTGILLRRFPHLKISGVDLSTEQIGQAKKRLKDSVKVGRVDFQVANAQDLPFKKESFDGAFVCWFLEHVSQPVEIMREVRRTLKPDSIVYCTEVMNNTLFLEPYSPATMQYWFAYNDHQWNLKGDPFVGAKLANILLDAGYTGVSTKVKPFHYDNRTPEMRSEMINYWTDLLLSGAPSLIKSKRVTPKLVAEMKKELKLLKTAPNSVFFYAYIQAEAYA